MKISIIGTGYVGLVSGTCFAEIGHDVTCIDIDENKVASLKEGKSPIFEPGLEELLSRNIKAKRISFSSSYDSVKDAEAVFLAVGTPSDEDGSADLKYLYAALDQVIEEMSAGCIVVIKSTVPVGTADDVRAYIKKKTEKDFFVVNNPEFLKEGAAIEDFMRPDRIVIGSKSPAAAAKISKIYEPFVRQGHPIYEMSNLSAEMTKYTANCFLATKISFINEIAKLCDATGADIDEVRKGISSDVRIGHHFLYPGPGYGGSCFPKDVKALIKTAKDHQSPLQIIECAESVNEAQRDYVFEKINKSFDNDLKGKTLALWGVAFKANTDDIRETSAIKISERLTRAGAKVKFYDPEAANNFLNFMEGKGISLESVEDKYACLDGADALVILTEWKEFQAPDFEQIKTRLKQPLLFDMRNLYNVKEVLEKGIKYVAIGRRLSN